MNETKITLFTETFPEIPNEVVEKSINLRNASLSVQALFKWLEGCYISDLDIACSSLMVHQFLNGRFGSAIKDPVALQRHYPNLDSFKTNTAMGLLVQGDRLVSNWRDSLSLDDALKEPFVRDIAELTRILYGESWVIIDSSKFGSNNE